MSTLRHNLDRLEIRNAESIQKIHQKSNAEKEVLKSTIQTLRDEIETVHEQKESAVQDAQREKNQEINQLRKSLLLVRTSLERREIN